MKKIKHPFAQSLYSRLEQAAVTCQLRRRQIKDLKFIRDKIASGHMTPELYDFINADGSLEALLPTLPRPSKEAACESLNMLQLSALDDIIAKEELAVSKWFTIIWEALKSWFVEWTDRNRFYVRNIRYYHALQRNNQDGTFGDIGRFGSTAVLMYHIEDWKTMLDASKKLREIKCPKKLDELPQWITKNKPVIAENISVFGMYLDEQDKFRYGTPKYIRQHSVCSSLGWLYQNLGRDIADVESALDDEISIRREFYELENLFIKHDANVKKDSNLLFVKSFIIASKGCSLILARSFNSFMTQIIRANSQRYRM